jgi:L-malate glycosyltransferase
VSTPERARTKARLLRIGDEPDPAYTRPLRVLLISVSSEVGGGERSLLEAAAQLPREVFDLQACCPPNSQMGRALRGAGIPVHDVPFRRFRRSANPLTLAGQVRALYKGASEVTAVCRQQEIELIHANTDSSAIVAWETARATHLPFIWHCRDMRPLHGLARVVSSAASAVVAISGAVEAHLRREGVKADKIRRIDNGVDLARFPERINTAEIRAAKRAELGIRAQAPVLISVGALVPWKRHERFVETLSAVRKRIPDAVGLLAGSDQFDQNKEYVRQIQERANRFGLGPNELKMLEQRDDVPALLAAADVLVSCSENEPFGRVLVEAAAAGMPVVSTRSGGKVEIVEEGVTGLLAAQTDIDALAMHCASLLQDVARRTTMGQMARLRAERLYDVRRTAAELAALFKDIAPARKSAHA